MAQALIAPVGVEVARAERHGGGRAVALCRKRCAAAALGLLECFAGLQSLVGLDVLVSKSKIGNRESELDTGAVERNWTLGGLEIKQEEERVGLLVDVTRRPCQREACPPIAASVVARQ